MAAEQPGNMTKVRLQLPRSIKMNVQPTRNTLPSATRKTAIEILNHIVADLFDLFARIKQAHWNVRGLSFIGLHTKSS